MAGREGMGEKKTKAGAALMQLARRSSDGPSRCDEVRSTRPALRPANGLDPPAAGVERTGQ